MESAFCEVRYNDYIHRSRSRVIVEQIAAGGGFSTLPTGTTQCIQPQLQTQFQIAGSSSMKCIYRTMSYQSPAAIDRSV